MRNTKYLHEILRPFFPERAEMKHIYGLSESQGLTRLHLELLRLVARNENADLMEIASLMNIGHVSAAEMVDTLIESGLITKKSGRKGLKFKVSAKAKKIREFEAPGFLSLKQIIDREREASSENSLLSPDHLNPPRYA
jgi:DNA-binding MarR family transcriptional regulator